MTTPESDLQPCVPSISFDAHFAQLPHLQEVRFNPVRCAKLLTHPLIGIPESDLPRLNIYVRPDYELSPYTDAERSEAKKANPDDYDDAACTEIVEKGEPIGRPNDILITLVYGSGYDVNELLCHEAIHARVMLLQTRLAKWKDSFAATLLPRIHNRWESAEEAEADQAMKAIALKGLRKNVIEIVKHKK